MSTFFYLLLSFSLVAVFAQPLPQLHLRNDTVTLSGISAGGFMAVQYQVAFSKSTRGALVVAGGPYWCSEGSLSGAMMCMNDPSFVNLNTMYAGALLAAAQNQIDPLASLASHNAWLFSGLFDTVVNQGTMRLLNTMYTTMFNVSSVTTFFNYTAEHAWITSDYGSSCSSLGSPYINNCGLDLSGAFLSDSFTKMNLKWNTSRGSTVAGNLYTFDQTQYGANPLGNSLDSTGYVYVPSSCSSNKGSSSSCHLHINFHGCQQSRTTLGTTYVLNTQITEWAEANKFVVLFPQTVPNDLKSNPNGCFDWWGYNNDAYATKAGAQMAAIFKMQQALTN
eukprot:PhF_6_TR13864/c0_g1_i1/m.22245